MPRNKKKHASSFPPKSDPKSPQKNSFHRPRFSPPGGQGAPDFEKLLEKRLGPDDLRRLAEESLRQIQAMTGASKSTESKPTIEFKNPTPPAELKNSSAPAQSPARPAAQTPPVATAGGRPLRGFALAQSKIPVATKISVATKIPIATPKPSPVVTQRVLHKTVKNVDREVVPEVVPQGSYEGGDGGFTTPGGIRLDAWQKEAVDALLAGKHIVVDAPTSAGKTRVIEALLEYRMKEGGKLIYTSPVKSLSNDKYREFCEKYGRDRVGINTGDFKENLSAPIILATLETYRNSLLGIEPSISRKVVVYDEYHFLQDESRGSAWEESIILTPSGSQLVLLSASVPNCDDFADWIHNLTGVQTQVIRVTKRPVPLVHVVYTKYGWILCDLLNLSTEEFDLFVRYSRELRATRPRFRGKEAYKEFLEPISQALRLNMGPIVVYAGRRGDVEGVALSLAKHIRAEMDPDFSAKLQNRVRSLSGFWEYVPTELQNLITRYGVAYHHSGMIPPGRVAIETLLKEGLLRICCGTMGISLGVNFAVRSAFVSDETRPSEGGDTKYSNTEIMQMLGRAGRRGHDAQGFSLWLHLGRFADQRPKRREPCLSSLKFDPTTVISILGQHKNIAYLSEFYLKSFFMRNKKNETLVRDNDVIAADLYKRYGLDKLNCNNMVETYKKFLRAKKKGTPTPCTTCAAKERCHSLLDKAEKSTLDKIVYHLQKVGALDGAVPTEMGNYARYFPQAGGLIIANWLATGVLTRETFPSYLQAMSAFGAAHFKEIPDTYADIKFLEDLNIPKLIDVYYPSTLFPELYDELKVRRYEEAAPGGPEITFREFNLGAASIVRHWLNPKTKWEELVAAHSSKYFSDGDCMNVLFRFATFLQSCSRLSVEQPALASEAKRLWKILLREPLDARNRLLAEEDDEFENVPESAQE